MHIEFLVEGPSAEAALDNIVPKIFTQHASYKIHVHQGKRDLLGNLPNRLKGYQPWLPRDWRIVVLVDADRDDCRQLKAQMTRAVHQAGLIPKSASAHHRFQVMNRLAIEELEAWFFGDVAAVNSVYPRIPLTLGNRAKYRNPDAIKSGTWEALQRELQRVGYHRSGLPKILVAREISGRMDPARNTSKSFQVFRQGLLSLIN